MQGLQHQGADAADQHAGEITVYLPADGVGAEQAGVALGVFEVELAERKAGQTHDLAFDGAADKFHGVSVPPASREDWLALNQPRWRPRK